MTDAFYKQDESVALATKHGKERAVSRPLRAGLGFRVVVPERIDTDIFSTFTGEIERAANRFAADVKIQPEIRTPGSPARQFLYKRLFFNSFSNLSGLL